MLGVSPKARTPRPPTAGTLLGTAGRAAALAALLALAACAGVDARTPRIREVDQFRVGVTMRSDAERLLGPPQYVAHEGEGRTALYWPSGPSGPQVPASAARQVKLVFDREGRLARPPEIAYPSRMDDPATGGPGLEPAARSPTCTHDADCAAGGICLAGTCRR